MKIGRRIKGLKRRILNATLEIDTITRKIADLGIDGGKEPAGE